MADESKCVNCHRCVSLCPTRALKIVKTDHTFKENSNWTGQNITDIYRQAETRRRARFPLWETRRPYPVYWDKMLINASQVTNPSIDPLREPMETKVFLGKKPDKARAGMKMASFGSQYAAAAAAFNTPIMFSAMSYGSISYNAHESLGHGQPQSWVSATTPAKAACMRTFISMAQTPSCRWPQDGSASIRTIWRLGRPLKLKWARAQSPGIGGHLAWGKKIVGDISQTRMIPRRHRTPSPRRRIMISIPLKTCGSWCYSLKEATQLSEAGHCQNCGGAQRCGDCQRHRQQRRGHHCH